MKKKLISFAIAFALLSQTLVFAGGLTTAVKELSSLAKNAGVTSTSVIIGSEVKGSGDTDFVSQTTDTSFDYRASIDFLDVMAKFNEYYDTAREHAEGYAAAFDAAMATGKFTVTITYPTDITGPSSLPTKSELSLKMPGGSAFEIDKVETAAGEYKVIFNVKDGITIYDLNKDIGVKDAAGKYTGMKFAPIILGLDGLTAAHKNTYITATLNGSVDFIEADETTPFVTLDFNGSATATAFYSTSSTGGGTTTGGGGGSSDSGNTGTGGSTTSSTNGESTTTTTTSQSGNTTTATATTTNSDGTTSTTTTTTTTSGNTTTTTANTTNSDGSTSTTKETATDNEDGSKTVLTETETTTADGEVATEITTVTEKDVSSDATVGVHKSYSTTTVTIVETKPNDVKPGFIGLGWAASPFATPDIDYNGTSVITVEVPVEVTTEVTEHTDENGDKTYTETVSEVAESITKYQNYAYMEIPEAFEKPITEEGLFVHKPYINGYPDGGVKPDNNMTREEVATAFVNILNDTFKETYATTEQNFPDVANDRWSNDPIATLTNAGILVGDDAGNFNPAKPITRAEFATIAAKFVPDAEPATNYFTDIDSHWAKDSILKVFGLGWTKGRGDGTFDPDAPITRAEVMQIINTMWTRFAKYDESENDWPDLNADAWYFDTVMDATTENVFARSENGVREVRVD
ncbi:MAG: S-layer homology domain-containing protein [Clostridia bacterium]|nr:S-layer homology domain-containing protein [Clostridia bacterium]